MKYYIPKFNLKKLISLMNRLAKKTTVKLVYDENKTRLARVLIDDGVYATYNEIEVEIEVDYKVGDYQIVAELEHTDAGNILRRINNELEIPVRYRDCKPYCEHCKTLRYRKNTFLLVDKSGDYKQVGSNCLNDYTGYDSQRIAEMCSDLSKLLNRPVEEDEDFMDYLGSLDWDDLKCMANKMYQILLDRGYDREDPFRGLSDYSYDEKLEPVVDELLKVINTDWFVDNEYCHNIKVLLQMQWIESKHWRLLISYLWSAMRYLDSKNIKNEWLGKVGDRVTFKCKSVKVLWANYNRWESSYYNDVYDYTYRIITTEGFIIVWSTGKELKADDVVKATIKSLDTYKDEKQTVVTRGSVMNG